MLQGRRSRLRGRLQGFELLLDPEASSLEIDISSSRQARNIAA